jgi:hypothetical protein
MVFANRMENRFSVKPTIFHTTIKRVREAHPLADKRVRDKNPTHLPTRHIHTPFDKQNPCSLTVRAFLTP